MKMRYYLGFLLVVVLLLIYNLFCYSFVNHRLKDATSLSISNYLNKDYEYLGATLNKNKTINIYVKTEKGYYNFIFERNEGYKLIRIENKIPEYAKKFRFL